MTRPLLILAALGGALAVAAGAFAAHGAGPQVKTLLTTGAQYQLVHALLGVVCALWTGGGAAARLAGWLATLGGLIFAGALYLVGLAGFVFMGIVAPVGGVLMIAAWLVLAYAAIRSQPLRG